MQLSGTIVAAFIGALLALTSSAGAQPHVDVHLYPQDGALRTGAFDFDAGGVFLPDQRAFAGFFGEVANGTNDPGFNASIGAFPAGAILSFNILDALRKWDGSDFDLIPAERMVVSLGASNRQTPTAPGGFVAGFNIAATLANGSFHQHVNYFLTSPFSPGVYLLTVELRMTSYAEPTAPLYIVFRQGSDSAAQAAALAYVQEVLLAPPVCEGDANADDMVNFADITAVLANFGFTGEPGIPGDSDRSGAVDFGDITFVLTNWGNTCG